MTAQEEGFLPETRLIEKQIAANKACNQIMEPSVLPCSVCLCSAYTTAVSLDPVQQRQRANGGKKKMVPPLFVFFFNLIESSMSKRVFVFQQPVIWMPVFLH